MNKKELHTLAANVARLSNLLTREREILPLPYLEDKGLRDAYILYYVPANMYKVHIPLKELSLHPSGIFRKNTLRILDLGSGPGTVILGVMDFFSSKADKPSLEFTAVDSVEENLRDAERLFRTFKEQTLVDASLLAIRSEIGRTKALPEGPFDMIILSNVLSEIFLPDHDRIAYRGRINFRINLLISLIRRNLASNGSCIIIEPALRETSRELLEVRDGLIREGLHVYSPCLLSDPCAALTNPKDWCHEDIPWEPPATIREIDKLTGLKKDSLKFSYLIIRNDTLSIGDICGTNSYRVVSEALISKGKVEYYLCGSGVRRLTVRLDKDKSNENEPFSGLKRGNTVWFKYLIDEGKRLKVVKETTVLTNPSL
ncbi:MAG: hypothetical protein IT392_11055 [Nitrospirae bacterium]|nr:hypothetical protein [Nitrospirota bacterium]